MESGIEKRERQGLKLPERELEHVGGPGVPDPQSSPKQSWNLVMAGCSFPYLCALKHSEKVPGPGRSQDGLECFGLTLLNA